MTCYRLLPLFIVIVEQLQPKIWPLINLKALCCFTTHSLSNNWHLPHNTQPPWWLTLHCISTSDRLLTLILMLNWYISAKWKFPSPLCLWGNGLENDRLYAIILLANQCSIHESVKSELNDVRLFFKMKGSRLHAVWD